MNHQTPIETYQNRAGSLFNGDTLLHAWQL